MNSYDLSRKWFDFAFENPDRICPTHTALYFFAIEHCNRLGWKEKFGFPTTMVMEALGIKSYNTFIKIFNDLIEFGFIKLIEKSKNQYSSNIIGLSNFNKALDKALDKALIKHTTKQSESTIQSIDSIIKQLTNKQLTNKQIDALEKIITKNKESIKVTIPEFSEFKEYALSKKPEIDTEHLKLKYEAYILDGWKDGNGKPIKNWKSKVNGILSYIKLKSNGKSIDKPEPYRPELPKLNRT